MRIVSQGSRESFSRPWAPWLEAFFISRARLYGGAIGGCTGSKLWYDPSALFGSGYERSESNPLRSPQARNGIYTLLGPSSHPLLQSASTKRGKNTRNFLPDRRKLLHCLRCRFFCKKSKYLGTWLNTERCFCRCLLKFYPNFFGFSCFCVCKFLSQIV